MHDSASLRVHQRQQVIDEYKVTQVINPERAFYAIHQDQLTEGVDAGIGDHHVQLHTHALHGVSAVDRRLEIRQLQRKWRGLPAHAGAGLLGFFQGAAGTDDMHAAARQHSKRFIAEAGVAAGHQCRLATQVYPFSHRFSRCAGTEAARWETRVRACLGFVRTARGGTGHRGGHAKL